MGCFGSIILIMLLLFSSRLYAGEWLIDGGILELGGSLSADIITVKDGASIRGDGTLKGASSIAGVLSPGKTETETATLTFLGPVTFLPGSVFECYAATHTILDKLIISGVVTGSCTVVLSKASAAVPLNQIVIDGLPASDYEQFSSGGSTPADWQLTSSAGDLLLTELKGDSDGDGMPDWWEDAYYHDRSAAHPDDDTDSDGMKNASEEIAGTDPTNSLSRLIITGINKENATDVTIAWLSVSNRLYAVHQESSLSNGFSTVVYSNLTAYPPENTIRLSVGADVRFYRISVRKKQ